MKGMIKSILKREGFELADIGHWLVAKKGDMKINIGFLNKDAPVEKETELLDGKKIVIPLDGQSYGDLKDVQVVDRTELYEDFVSVLFGENDFTSSVFYELMGADETWDDFRVERVGDHEESIIKPVMTFEDVVELSKKTVKGFRFVLELVPHYVFHYGFDLKSEGEPIRKSGEIGVNGLTRKCDLWKQNFETVSTLERTHKRMEPKINEGDALELARTFILEKFTFATEKVVEKEHTVVIESMKTGPGEDDLEVELEGMFYLPIWCIEGTNGVMIVNAAAGKIIEEDYYVKSP